LKFVLRPNLSQIYLTYYNCLLVGFTVLWQKFFLKCVSHFVAKYVGKYAEFGEICAEVSGKYAKYAAYMRIFTYAA